VSTTVRQALLIAVLSAGWGFVCVAVARRRLLSLRYTLGWLAMGVLGLLFALLAGLVRPVSDLLGVSPTAVFALAGIGVLLLIALQLSISVSGLQSQVQTLAEAHALLEERLHAQARPDDG
jgi:hypothetical protein